MQETKSSGVANKYPKNLETFILLEKMKEKSEKLKKVGEQVQKLNKQFETYDYMEPISIAFPDVQQHS